MTACTRILSTALWGFVAVMAVAIAWSMPT